MNAPGKGMLKVSSILFIIFGAIGTIVSLFSVFAMLAAKSLLDQMGGLQAVVDSAAAELGDATGALAQSAGALQGAVAAFSTILFVAVIISIIISIATLIIGIMGVGKAGDASKAGFFVGTGIALCALQLVSIIITMVGGGAFPFMSLIGFVLPILYIVGGNQNKNAGTSAAA